MKTDDKIYALCQQLDLQGKSHREIAAKLNDLGITRPNGKRWGIWTVSYILKGPSVCETKGCGTKFYDLSSNQSRRFCTRKCFITRGRDQRAKPIEKVCLCPRKEKYTDTTPGYIRKFAHGQKCRQRWIKANGLTYDIAKEQPVKEISCHRDGVLPGELGVACHHYGEYLERKWFCKPCKHGNETGLDCYVRPSEQPKTLIGCALSSCQVD